LKEDKGEMQCSKRVIDQLWQYQPEEEELLVSCFMPDIDDLNLIWSVSLFPMINKDIYLS